MKALILLIAALLAGPAEAVDCAKLLKRFEPFIGGPVIPALREGTKLDGITYRSAFSSIGPVVAKPGESVYVIGWPLYIIADKRHIVRRLECHLD